jgi:hypothetical protein
MFLSLKDKPPSVSWNFYVHIIIKHIERTIYLYSGFGQI